MRIAYDLRRIANLGIGRYMKALVESVVRLAPQHEYVFIMAPGTEHLIETTIPATRVIARSRYYSISEQFELPTLLRKHSVDLLHAPHFVVPVKKTCPTIVTIHDVIHMVYPRDIRSPIGRVYASLMMKCAVKVADKIVTISEYSRDDIIRFVSADPAKISIIPPILSDNIRQVRDPASLNSIRSRYGIARQYIPYVGIFRERKNHAGLLRAFAKLVQLGYDLDLVISGPVDQGKAILSDLAQKLGIDDRLKFAGFVPDSDLPGLLSGAAIYACPSLYEGFGYTPLEAMACGVPVVCHRGTSLPEVCGEAAVYADATDPDQFADALRKVLDDSDLRARMVRLGFQNVQRFSHETSAIATLKLYSELLGLPLTSISSQPHDVNDITRANQTGDGLTDLGRATDTAHQFD